MSSTTNSLSETSSIEHTIVLNRLVLFLMRASWVVIVALAILAAILGIQARYDYVLEDSLQHASTYAEMDISLEFPSIYFNAMQILAIAFVMLLAFLLFLRRSNSWFMCFLSLSIISNGFSSGPLRELNTIHPEWGWLSWLLGYIFINLYALIWWLFPDGRFAPRWSRWFLIIFPLWTLITIPSAVDLGLSPTIQSLVEPLLVATALTIGTAGLLALRYRYYQATDTVRQQIKWLSLGMVVWFVCFVLWFLVVLVVMPALEANMPQLERLLWLIFFPLPNWGSIILALTLMLGISRYRLYDIDVVINRSLVTSGVILVLAVAFIAGAFLIQSLLGAENALLAWLVSIAIPALLFNPVQRQVRNFIDRRVYGLRFDMNEARAVQRDRPITNPGQHTGRTLGGYKVLDLIGTGGMGEVYKGQANGQIVAIKVLQSGAIHSEDLLKRFIREAQTGMALDHRNIAKVYDVGEEAGTHYIVMEYIDGQDVREHLKHQGAFDQETATRIMQDVCTGLALAHEQGFVHRDIKPDNVMLRENGEAVLMDFGVTKSLNKTSSLTGTGMIGTAYYMAPEQIKSDQQLDQRADIYALGVMLYEMLTGEKPFTGGMIQVIFAHLNQPVPDVCDLNDEIPREIAKAIHQAMAKDPDKRFATANDFMAALDEARI